MSAETHPRQRSWPTGPRPFALEAFQECQLWKKKLSSVEGLWRCLLPVGLLVPDSQNGLAFGLACRRAASSRVFHLATRCQRGPRAQDRLGRHACSHAAAVRCTPDLNLATRSRCWGCADGQRLCQHCPGNAGGRDRERLSAPAGRHRRRFDAGATRLPRVASRKSLRRWRRGQERPDFRRRRHPQVCKRFLTPGYVDCMSADACAMST